MSTPMNSTANLTSGRTYGNWRRPRSAGMFGQSARTTYTGLAGLVISIGAILISPLTGAVAMALVVTLMAPLVVRFGGRTLYQHSVLWWQWSRQRRRRQHIYRSGPLSSAPGGTHRLPGLLAASTLYEGEDAYGRPFAMVHFPHTSTYTVVLRADPQGAALVSQAQVDAWVAGWAYWLGELGQASDIVGAAAVIDTAPDSGERLRAEVNHLIRPDAPELARQVMLQSAQEFPSGSAAISARIAITFRATTADRRRNPDEMAVEVGTRMPELYSTLREAGIDAVPMDSWSLSETVRVAYDPAAQQAVEQARGAAEGAGVMWTEAGPTAHEERWGSYRHDSGFSVTYAMEEAPRGSVRERILRRLLEPNPELARKRITLIYRPHNSGDAAAIVDGDYKDAIVAASRKGLPPAAAQVELEATSRARDEEARGAGVVRFSILMTATVNDESELRRTESVLLNLAGGSRLRVRRCFGYQAAAFAAGLGVGVLLPDHATIPGSLAN